MPEIVYHRYHGKSFILAAVEEGIRKRIASFRHKQSQNDLRLGSLAILRKPCLAQFVIMPSLAWVLTRLFQLPAELAIGVILVGCCPGGTASNVITYLSKGDVALSVGMTGISTLLAPVMTPLLVKLFAGQMVPVDFWGMFLSIVEVIIVPIALGLLIKRTLPKVTAAVTPYLAAFSTIVITLIVIAVVSANASSLHSCGLTVILVVILHNICGYALGYGAGRALGLSHPQRTAISVEVGMQNSGLACSLASSQFAAMALASVPGAVFSVWHNISGALIARLFVRKNAAKTKKTSQIFAE